MPDLRKPIRGPVALDMLAALGTATTDGGDQGGYEPLSQEVARKLRDSIFNGRLKPGMPIRQEALAQELGVSRIPVREALRQLEAEGLVDIRPNSGARVSLLDFEECLEIYKIRERLEPLAFSESVVHLTDEQRNIAVELEKDLEAKTGDPNEWLAGDRRLHLAMYSGIQTPRLLRLIVGMWNTTQRYRRLLLTTFSDIDFDNANIEHRLMIDAIREGNIRAGEELVRIAMERSRLRLTKARGLFDQ
jgi:DNA-binding GntR family transcriptional regulator